MTQQLPEVRCTAVIQTGSVLESKPVVLYETLPAWWNRVDTRERQRWLTEYFRRALALQPEQKLVSVTWP